MLIPVKNKQMFKLYL